MISLVIGKLLLIFLGLICLWMVIAGYKFIFNTIPFSNIHLWNLKKYFFITSLLLMFLAFLDFNKKESNITNNVNEGIDLIFILDFTASMRVIDSNGLSRIKSSIEFLVFNLENFSANRLGLMIFSERNYKLIPLTKDIEFFRDQLISLENNVMPEGGGNLDSVLEEINQLYKNNSVFLLFSDFEKIGLNKNQIDKLNSDDNLIAVGVGSISGGKIPKRKTSQIGKDQYERNNGKIIYSYFDTKTFNNFKNKYLLDQNLLQKIDEFIFLKNKKDDDAIKEGFVSVDNKDYGNYFVFASILLLSLSRLLLLFEKRMFFVFFIFFINPIESFSNEKVIINGDGDYKDFLILGNHFIEEKKYDSAYLLYKEQISNLDALEEINLASLEFINNKKTQAIKRYLDKIISHENISAENLKKIKDNLIYFLNNNQGSSGQSSTEESNNRSNNDSEGNSGDQSSSKSGQNNKNSSLTSKEILNNLKNDDLVNQGEYINKKMKSSPEYSRDIRW